MYQKKEFLVFCKNTSFLKDCRKTLLESGLAKAVICFTDEQEARIFSDKHHVDYALFKIDAAYNNFDSTILSFLNSLDVFILMIGPELIEIDCLRLFHKFGVQIYLKENAKLSSLIDKIKIIENENLDWIARISSCPIKSSNNNYQNDLLRVFENKNPSDPLLITGETGVGKTYIARLIHEYFNYEGEYVEINCANISEDLFEGTLFGIKEGGFTGAKNKIGLFELANNGVIFFDEFHALSLNNQMKLLTVIEDKKFRKVGDNELVSSNFKLILATNENIETLLQTGKLRKDFYARVSKHILRVPPLRERKSDIKQLFISLLNSDETSELGYCLNKEAERKLLFINTSENIRTLKNIIYDIKQSPKTLITVNRINKYIESASTQNKLMSYPEHLKSKGLRESILEFERQSVIQIEKEASLTGNKEKTYKKYGIDRNFMHRLKKKHEIEKGIL